jgi:hypothetical protein
MPAQNVLPGEDVHDKLVEMGTKRIFIYDGGEGGSPASAPSRTTPSASTIRRASPRLTISSASTRC